MRKYARVREALRKEIVGGEFPAGSSIPTWDKLQHRFGVSRSTIRLALQDLKEEGFLRPAGRNGTLVTEAPPHLCRYALVLPQENERTEGQFSLFWQALEAEVRETVGRRHDGEGRVRIFYGVEEGAAAEEEFLDDIATHQYAGLIFGRDSALLHNPRVEQAGVPRVYIGSHPDSRGIPAVYPDTHLFMNRALDRLASVGCKRVAVLTVASYRRYFGDCIKLARNRGFLIHPWWVHTMEPYSRDGAKSWARLLMSLPEDERPDGLVITDDHLATPASQGLFNGGVADASDCHTVVLANFPRPPRCLVDVDYLGYDAATILESALDAIDSLRAGEPAPSVTRIKPHFRREPPHEEIYGELTQTDE